MSETGDGSANSPANGSGAVERVDQIAVRVFACCRVLALLESAPLGCRRSLVLLFAVVAAESGGLIWAVCRRGGFRKSWVAGDVLFIAGAFWVCAVLTAAQDCAGRALLFPFGLVAATGVGLGTQTLGETVLLGAFLALNNALPMILGDGEPVWKPNRLPDSVAYIGHACLAWLVARYMRRSARLLDESQRAGVRQARDLARERERSRAARALHDRVLQTLELLGRPPWITDDRLRDHVAAEAAWLRRFVEHAGDGPPGDLLAALADLADRHTRAGLRVDLHDGLLRQAPAWRAGLAPEMIEAILGATDEALTNVAKHAGASRAVVRAEPTAAGVLVTVVDHGSGFDPAGPSTGLGVRESIRARLHDAGGSAVIDSAPGHGTRLELHLPARSAVSPASAAQAPRKENNRNIGFPETIYCPE